MFPSSPRLIFRNWTPADVSAFQEVNGDPEVMAHFPSVLNETETAALIDRLTKHYSDHGFTYFAVELKESGEFIGFIGMARQTYEASFTPCVDIGWRLKRSAWGHGYATEGAVACLDFAWRVLGLDSVYAVAVAGNLPSIKVMRRVGMQYDHHFFHLALDDHPDLQKCAVYRIDAPNT
ncbi:GNAT family N-acetyltransferase [Lewinellaceae bacterium SD302]|nr:GNAT family N-acetyltransferase [Lewinellaceae bacterium SD302]